MKREHSERLDAIIRELNYLKNARDDLEGLGAVDMDQALNYRADSWDGKYEDYVPPTPEEIELIKAECERNEKKVFEIDNKMDDLIAEYYGITGVCPHLYELTGTYARSWHEKSEEASL